MTTLAALATLAGMKTLALTFAALVSTSAFAQLACPAGERQVVTCGAPGVGADDDKRVVEFLDAAIVCQVPETSLWDYGHFVYRDARTQASSGVLPLQEVMSLGPSFGLPDAASTFEVVTPAGLKLYLNFGLFTSAMPPPVSNRTPSSVMIMFPNGSGSRALSCDHADFPRP